MLITSGSQPFLPFFFGTVSAFNPLIGDNSKKPLILSAAAVGLATLTGSTLQPYPTALLSKMKVCLPAE